MWYELLKPVFIKFVETFDDPESENIKDFWQKIAHYSGGGSGLSYLSGSYLPPKIHLSSPLRHLNRMDNSILLLG